MERSEPRATATLWPFVVAVTAGGALALAAAIRALPTAFQAGWIGIAALALLTVIAGGFKIRVPGQPATVSVSEFFIFISLLLFGPAPATVTVALDGLWTSLTQQNKRWYRTLFNIAEPALGVWLAGTFYVAVLGPDKAAAGELRVLVAVLAMTLVFFVSNSVLTALAVGFESHTSAFQLWKRHSFYLGVNYYAAAALAMLAVESGMRVAVAALIAPLLVLSYVAYRAVSTRVEESARHTKEVEHLYQATIETLAVAVDAKDEVTHGHVRRVQRHTVALARALGVTEPIEIQAIEAAALLHDVGKLAVPDYVLNKPGALTQSEFAKIKLHVNAGATILSAVEFPYPVVPIVRGHHEQWNGRGYPDGLAGERIPIGARILAVVDCFDAVTSDRPYRRRMTDAEALAILQARSGTMYDPRVVHAFVALIPALRQEDLAIDTHVPTTMDSAPHANTSLGDGRSTADEETVSLAELTRVAPAAFAQLRRRLPEAEACLMFKHAGTEHLVPAHATPRVGPALANGSFQLGEGVSGWVAAHRYRIVNSDPALDLGDAAERLNLRSCMSVPVFACGDLVGVLSVYLAQPRAFTDADVRAIGALAQEIGVDAMRGEGQTSAGEGPAAFVA